MVFWLKAKEADQGQKPASRRIGTGMGQELSHWGAGSGIVTSLSSVGPSARDSQGRASDCPSLGQTSILGPEALRWTVTAGHMGLERSSSQRKTERRDAGWEKQQVFDSTDGISYTDEDHCRMFFEFKAEAGLQHWKGQEKIKLNLL